MTSFPVSEDQARLWRLWRLFPAERAAFHVGAAAHVRGPLDLEAFAVAIGEIADHHSVLRTRLIAVPDGVERRIEPPRGSPIAPPIVDVRGGAPDDVVEERFRGFLERPIDLFEGPLWRTELLRFDERHHVLTFACHHIVSDYRSVALFFDELRGRYEREIAPARSCALSSEERGGDVDERAWRRVLFEEGRGSQDGAERWWRTQLTGVRPLQLGDPRRAPGASARAATRFVRLGDELMARVDAQALARGVRSASLHLFALQRALAPFAAGAPFVVGMPVDQRRGTRDRNAMGFFASPRLVRCEPGRGSDDEQLRRADLAVTGMLRRRAVPLARLSALLEAESPGAGGGLQALFSYVARDQPGDEGESLAVARARCGPARMTSSLWLTVDRAAEDGVVQLDYAVDDVGAERAAAFADRYEAALRELAPPAASQATSSWSTSARPTSSI